jgi:hypothetical protein
MRVATAAEGPQGQARLCQETTLKAMQRLSRAVLFTTVPGTQRRKRPGKRVLGIT